MCTRFKKLICVKNEPGFRQARLCLHGVLVEVNSNLITLSKCLVCSAPRHLVDKRSAVDSNSSGSQRRRGPAIKLDVSSWLTDKDQEPGLMAVASRHQKVLEPGLMAPSVGPWCLCKLRIGAFW